MTEPAHISIGIARHAIIEHPDDDGTPGAALLLLEDGTVRWALVTTDEAADTHDEPSPS